VITTGVVCRDFIGRRSELELLIDQVVRPPRGRPGSTVLVQGDAGIGKSRLMREFAAALTSRGITPVVTTCYEFGEAPYAPLLEIAEGLGATAAVNALGSPVAADDAASGRERTRRFAAFAAALGTIVQATTVVAVAISSTLWRTAASCSSQRCAAKTSGRSAARRRVCARRSSASRTGS
jgi:predicted ATPase